MRNKIWIIVALLLTPGLVHPGLAHAWIDGLWSGQIVDKQGKQEISILIDGESDDLFGTVSGKEMGIVVSGWIVRQ